MGTSFTVVKKDFATLSVEVETDIQIEISSGWPETPEQNKCAHFGASVHVSVVELGSLIHRLQDIQRKLLKAWYCPECKYIQEFDKHGCYNCDKPLRQYKAKPA